MTFWEKKLDADLRKLCDAISTVDGVLAVILFGSRARGDYDEYSDYDILVVFDDAERMWRNIRNLYEAVSQTGCLAQVQTRTLLELLEKTEPTFLSSVLQHGILIYARYPITLPTLMLGAKNMMIIKYDLRNLTQAEKAKFNYRLFGRRTPKYHVSSLLEKIGGQRLGDGCVIVRRQALPEVLKFFRNHKIRHGIQPCLVPAEGIKPEGILVRDYKGVAKIRRIGLGEIEESAGRSL